jgi:hypothetical protein
MPTRVSHPRLNQLLILSLTLAALVAITRAQSSGFYAKRTEIQNQAKAEQQAAGLAGSANRKALYTQFPTPEIALGAPVVVAPGQPVPLQLTGKFSEKTTFVSGSDRLVLSGVTVAAGKLTATAHAPQTPLPGWARIYAFSPVSAAETWTPVFVGTVPPAVTLTASNGWTITLTPDAPKFAITSRDAKVGYKAEFYKPGEARPFETTSGTLTLDANNTSASLHFGMQPGNQGSAMAEMQQLSARMGELMKAGKYTGKEMQDLQKKLEVTQERVTKELEAQIKDPAAMQRKQDDFGCGSISLEADGANVKGGVSCGKNVGSLQLKGTVGAR